MISGSFYFCLCLRCIEGGKGGLPIYRICFLEESEDIQPLPTSLFGLFIVLTRYVVWVEVLPLATGIAHSITIWTGKWQVLQMPAQGEVRTVLNHLPNPRDMKNAERSLHNPRGKSTPVLQ